MSRKSLKLEKITVRNYNQFRTPLVKIMKRIPKFVSRGNKPFKVTFENLLDALIWFHLQEHVSGRHLVQSLQEDTFARDHIAPKDGMAKSTFFEAITERGFEPFQMVFEALQQEACSMLPRQYTELGKLVAIDGSLIDATFSMTWADYRKNAKKAKTHLGFDLNRGIPHKLFLTPGKDGERPFVDQIIQPGETAVTDRGYQSHSDFDRLQESGRHFVCRIRENTIKTVLSTNSAPAGSIVFFDATVRLGTKGVNQSQTPLRLVGYTVSGSKYWIATNRFDLTGEQIAEIYKLRWTIETFFAWWKQHLKVYHLISRSKQGLMIQMLAGMITYLLLAIYCREQYNEPVSIYRVRQLRHAIINESRMQGVEPSFFSNPSGRIYASP